MEVKRGKRISERRLVDVLVHHARPRFFTAREVPHYEKRIDVVAVERHTGEVRAIEVKVSDWPRALSQAIVNQAAADRSYIALHSETAHRVSWEELERTGIGLISIGSRWGDVRILKDARPSTVCNKITLSRLRTAAGGG